MILKKKSFLTYFLWGLLASMLLILMISPPATSLNVRINQPEHKELIGHSFSTLKNACPQLFNTYAGDIIDIKASISDIENDMCSFDHWCEKYEWKRYVDFEVSIKNETKHIPNHVRANGHTLFYKLGSGNSPGISTMKPQSAHVCGWQSNTDDVDMITSIPSLNFIK